MIYPLKESVDVDEQIKDCHKDMASYAEKLRYM